MIKEMLPEIWKNKSQIAEGIKNLAFKKEDVEQLKLFRENTCKTCIWYNLNQKGKPFEEIPEVIRKVKSKDWIEEVVAKESPKCIHCGCGLGENSIKLRCTACACPIGKWVAVTTPEEQDEIDKIIQNES